MAAILYVNLTWLHSVDHIPDRYGHRLPSTSILSASAAEKPPNIISGVVMSLDDVRIYYLQNGSHADAMRCNVLAWSAVSMTRALANGWWIMG